MINIRAGAFETNSSSVHSLILCTADDYRDWINGDKLLNIYYDDDWAWKHWDREAGKYVETTVGMPPQFVTSEEATYYDKYYPYPEMEENGWGYFTDFRDENGEYHDRKFLTFEEYEKFYSWNFETFDEVYTTPKGEEVVGFGYFGRDG